MYLYSRRMGRKAMKRASLFLILTLLLASLITGMPSFAGINDVTAEGFGIAANNLSAGWTTGNLGKTFQEGEWVAFQITVRNLDWEQLPYIGARFDFYDDARFYDLIRNISVGATPLDDTQGYPDALGDPAPIGTMAELNLAQRNPEEYYFDGFTPVVIPPENWGDQLNVFDIEGNVGSETDETRVFFITREQIQAADPSLIGSDTLVLYFQLHLARSWLWENTSTFDVGGTDYTLPLAYAYTYPPTDKWGGYVYDESFLSMTMPGSGAYPGSSGHSYVLMPGGEKTLPIPDLAEPEGMISGYKYEDTNGNGVYDMGIDLPIEGWPIYLRTDLYALEDIEFSTMTDENGYFFFENLPYNLIWEITEGSMEGYSQLAPNADSPTDGVYDPDGDVETTRWMKAFDFGFEGREPWGWSVKLSNDNRYRENVNFLNGTYGSLTVTKEVLFGDTVYPDDYFNGTTFDITLTGPSYPTGDTQTFTYPGDLEYTWEQLIPGEYTLSEDTLGNEWSFSVSADPVVIDPSEDETATVTNTYVPGSLEVTKVVNLNDVIGSPTIPSFDITITGPSYPSGDTKTASYPDGLVLTWNNLIPGDYTVSEGALGTEWDVTVPADPVTVVTGQKASATVTNDYVPGSLEVAKVVNLNDVIGSPTIPSFDITITGPSYPSGDTKTASYPDGLVLTWNNLIPGDYTVSEGALGTEWDVTIPAGPVTVVTGQKATATVTNDYVPGSLKVTKSVDLGDTIVPEDYFEGKQFEITITGPSYPGGDSKMVTYPGDLEVTWNNLIPGFYTVTETDSGNVWTVEITGSPAEVVAGQQASASVKNTFVPGSLEVTKVVDLNNVIGSPTIPSFDITITGPSYPSGDTKTASYPDGLVLTWNNLIPGDYTVSEGALGTEWDVTIPAGPVTVVTGQKATATVTNDYVPGSLEVTKVVNLNDVIGSPTIPNFNITITGPSYPSGDTKTASYPDGLVLTWNNLIPGDYTVSEGALGTEWDVTIPAGPVTVVTGQQATATVTNDYVPGSLEVTKVVNLNDVIGSPTIPSFEITITGPSYPSGDMKTATYPDGLVLTWSNLIPGDYTVSEGALGTEWDVTIPAGPVTVVTGQKATATVTNDYVPGSLKVTKSVDLGDTIVPEDYFEGKQFEITITGPSYPGGDSKMVTYPGDLEVTWNNLIPGFYTVTETDPGSMWTVEISGSPAEVITGQQASASVKNTFVPGSLEITKHVSFGGAIVPEGYYDGTEFDITITGPSYPSGNTKTATYPGTMVLTWNNLIPGDYQVTEEGTGDEWDVTVPTDDVIVVSNQKVTADVYNDLLPGSLEVTKEVILGNLVDPEGLYDSIDFKITITGPSYPTGDTQTFNYPSMLSYKWDNLIPGEYTVTEENPGSEWKVVVPAGAITVDPSEDETAEVTNTFLPGSLEVTKEVILGNLVDPEGLYDSIDFKITITGPSYPTGDTQTFNYPSMLSYKWDNLIPGDYTVTEENPGSEWKVEVPAGAINVAPDEEETATVTNTFLPAELRINKFFIGGFEEMIPAFIEVRVTGSSYPTGEVFKVDISGTEGTLLLENLLPGEYLVEELTFEYSAYWKSSISGSPATLVPDGWATVNINNVWAYTDETAWGYLPDHAIPFTDLDKKLKNWGWTNGPLDEGSYTMDLIAGAGGNDLSAGMKVGEVYVEIERVTSSSSIVVRVTYDTTTEAMSYLMTESHLWVGTTELPLIRNKMTNAPGQFPYGDMEDGYKYEFTVEIPDPGGEVAIYVAAHAVVQIPIDD